MLQNNSKSGDNRTFRLIVFAALAVAWIALDQITKAYFSYLLEAGSSIVIVPSFLSFSLVHNVGAAWGIFGGATFALVALSCVVCAAIAIYLFKSASCISMLSIVGLSLVFAGGIGNMIDRIVNGYVIDFIEATFIDFPVFNVADIGVTCGIVLFFIGIFLGGAGEGEAGEAAGEGTSGETGEGGSQGGALKGRGEDD